MMKLRLFAVIFLSIVILGALRLVPKAVAANAACNPDSPYCTLVWTDYLEDQYDDVCLQTSPYTCTRVLVGRIWVRRQVCSVEQAGGGSCVCCTDAGGCYLDCPSVPTPGPGDPDPTPEPTLPPGTTPTNTPVPPVCQNMYYCNTSSYTCQLTSSQYSVNSPYPRCGNASPTCSQNLETNLPGQTTGTCFTSLSACQFSCIAPPGTVRMRAALVPSGTNVCSAVTSSTNYTAVGVTLYPDGTSKTTSGTGSYASATWANSNPGTKSFVDDPPSGYILALACYNTTSQPAYSSGYTASLLTGETLTWQLGYTAGVGWFQSQGGDVYAASTLRSYIPINAVGGRYFVGNGSTGGMPGVVTFGSTFDFDNAAAQGAGYVSTKNWLVNETQANTDYYAVMYHRFGSPTTANYSGNTTLNSKLASQSDPYYVNGNLTIDTPTDWTVGNNETITVLVNGDLTINNRINITGTGFVAFIVNGNITIDSSVGTTSTSATPVIEGIYITSPSGAFRTSTSTTAAARRFVGKGTFIAGTFTLERDLDADARNIDYAAELFIYNPELMLRMPDKMKDLPVSWQEVAP